ncbi:MAG: hypothetical protein JSW70_00885 [Syntrophobacterales bacterium]|nr:MAG: hypothetical protein JSW70_00885 [Syntrophobacterales bacterium]
MRVVPNKFPFFHIEGELDKRPKGMYDLMNAIGVHESIIETPDHGGALGRMEPDQIQRILKAYKKRSSDLAGDKRFRQILILKNHPGIFYLHPHSHVIAMPVIPRRHSPDFTFIGDDEMWDLAAVMGNIFRRLSRLLQNPPYSFSFHSSPIHEENHRSEYHWHVEVRPRIGLREGFEWGMGFFVNSTPPEFAATHLRQAG